MCKGDIFCPHRAGSWSVTQRGALLGEQAGTAGCSAFSRLFSVGAVQKTPSSVAVMENKKEKHFLLGGS